VLKEEIPILKNEIFKGAEAMIDEGVDAGIALALAKSHKIAQAGIISMARANGVNAMMYDDGDGLLDPEEIDAVTVAVREKQEEEKETGDRTVWEAILGSLSLAALGAFGTWGKSAHRAWKKNGMAQGFATVQPAEAPKAT
jgi:hypothetical protein